MIQIAYSYQPLWNLTILKDLRVHVYGIKENYHISIKTSQVSINPLSVDPTK